MLLLAGLLLLGAGCASESRPTPESITYTLPSDGSVTVTRSFLPASDVVVANDLLAQAQECGYARDAQYYLDLENLYKWEQAQQYTFSAKGDDGTAGSWTVTTISNAAKYSSFESFKQDFDICAVGGVYYPLAVGDTALVMSSSCGSGYTAEGSSGNSGCEAARDAVLATISAK